MSRAKQVVPTMPQNIWQILEKAWVPMGSFALNMAPEQYNWMLPDIDEGPTKVELAKAPLIFRPKMPIKQDRLVMLIPVIPIAIPIPQPTQPPIHAHHPQ